MEIDALSSNDDSPPSSRFARERDDTSGARGDLRWTLSCGVEALNDFTMASGDTCFYEVRRQDTRARRSGGGGRGARAAAGSRG